MSTLTIVYASLFYLAAAVLLVGTASKVVQYARAPAPLKIPTTPAPITRGGVVARLFREIVLFESLFKGSKWSWLFGWLFHAGLLIVLLRHLRYFTEPIWTVAALAHDIGVYMGWLMVLGLLGLLARRLLVDRLRYISSPSDYLMLLLLAGIGLSGLLIKYVAHTDIVLVKAFTLGLLRLDWQPLPQDPVLLVHLALVIVLMLVFPISKLLHGPAILFSPTRNQIDNPREQRHVAPWARAMENAGATDTAGARAHTS